MAIIATAALSPGGMLERVGILAVPAHHLDWLSRGIASFIGVATISAVSINVLAAEQYIGIVIPDVTLRSLYEERGLQNGNLLRAIESAGATASTFVPWNSGTLLMAGALGVGTLEYASYYFFGLLPPLILLLIGVTERQIAYQSGKAPGDAGNRRGSSSSTDD